MEEDGKSIVSAHLSDGDGPKILTFFGLFIIFGSAIIIADFGIEQLFDGNGKCPMPLTLYPEWSKIPINDSLNLPNRNVFDFITELSTDDGTLCEIIYPTAYWNRSAVILKVCSNHLQRTLTPKNAVFRMRLALEFCDEYLRKTTARFSILQIEQILRENSWNPTNGLLILPFLRYIGQMLAFALFVSSPIAALLFVFFGRSITAADDFEFKKLEDYRPSIFFRYRWSLLFGFFGILFFAAVVYYHFAQPIHLLNNQFVVEYADGCEECEGAADPFQYYSSPFRRF